MENFLEYIRVKGIRTDISGNFDFTMPADQYWNVNTNDTGTGTNGSFYFSGREMYWAAGQSYLDMYADQDSYFQLAQGFNGSFNQAGIEGAYAQMYNQYTNSYAFYDDGNEHYMGNNAYIDLYENGNPGAIHNVGDLTIQSNTGNLIFQVDFSNPVDFELYDVNSGADLLRLTGNEVLLGKDPGSAGAAYMQLFEDGTDSNIAVPGNLRLTSGETKFAELNGDNTYSSVYAYPTNAGLYTTDEFHLNSLAFDLNADTGNNKFLFTGYAGTVIDANNIPIINVIDGVNANDAVNFSQISGFISNISGQDLSSADNSTSQFITLGDITNRPYVETIDTGAISADISATTFSLSGVGAYQVFYELVDVANDALAGAVQLSVTYNDGTARTDQSSAVALTIANVRDRGSFFIVNVTGNIQYAVGHTGIFGSATYRLIISLVKLS